MTSNPTVLAAALAVAAAAPLQAQLAVGEIGTAAVIDFNSAIANVNSYSAEATGTNANIYEPNNRPSRVTPLPG